MLKFDTAKGKLISLQETNLIDESILERYGFQAAIISSWNDFCSELGMGELYYVDSEVIPHDSCRDSIDILALDWEGTPVVIELKRAKHKLQLLQALSYAAMLSTWTTDDYISRTSDKPHADDVRCLMEGVESLPAPRIVLVAEGYDPEVILTADFLRNHDIDITAIAVSLVKHDNELLMTFDRRYPLPGLEDTYTARAQPKKKVDHIDGDVTWEDVISWSKVTWVSDAINEFKRLNFGGENPARRGFGTKRNTTFGNIISLGFRTDHMVVHVIGQTQEDADRITNLINLPIEPWGRAGDRRSGWAFRIYKEEDFRLFAKALENKR
jgi:hypothetical protein